MLFSTKRVVLSRLEIPIYVRNSSSSKNFFILKDIIYISTFQELNRFLFIAFVSGKLPGNFPGRNLEESVTENDDIVVGIREMGKRQLLIRY